MLLQIVLYERLVLLSDDSPRNAYSQNGTCLIEYTKKCMIVHARGV